MTQFQIEVGGLVQGVTKLFSILDGTDFLDMRG